ncbi:hypothetical protein EUGRSUZ_I00179 [Eucalyptus grandis]|uniref:Uncharacterized protein n=2 Tax=Eucalyptus grandis TaxID=71139 RepID=A0ACC3JBW0_EUCGR|nr:hypothetical protein EUGRSUZ_I00179 [Eucalyptus grandis]
MARVTTSEEWGRSVAGATMAEVRWRLASRCRCNAWPARRGLRGLQRRRVRSGSGVTNQRGSEMRRSTQIGEAAAETRLKAPATGPAWVLANEGREGARTPARRRPFVFFLFFFQKSNLHSFLPPKP